MLSKSIIFFAAFLCMTLAPSLAAKCSTSTVNIRSGPSTGNRKVARAVSGDAFTVLDSRQNGGYNWINIARCGSSQPVGWMVDKWTRECDCPGSTNSNTNNNNNNNNNGNNNPPPVSNTGGFGLKYDKPRRCSGGATRGINALKNVAMRHFPHVRNGGTYNCRSVRGGGTLSEHGEGRAWDAMNNIGEPAAQRLADWLVANAAKLGIQSVIYNRRVWGYGRWNWRRYNGQNPHKDHVHVGMNKRASSGLTEAMVEAAFDGRPAPSTPRPSRPTNPGNNGNTGNSAVVCLNAALNIRSVPRTSGSRVLAVGYAGEEFTKQSTSGGWIKISNNRVTGWGYGRYIGPCRSAMRMGVEGEDDGNPVADRVEDGPAEASAVPEWAIGLIAGIVGTVAIVIVAQFVLRKRRASINLKDGSEPLLGRSPSSSRRSVPLPRASRSPNLNRRVSRSSASYMA